jgi:hypothetical protein
MKQLKFKFDLDCKVSIYVPSTINVNEAVDNTEIVRRTISELASMFGGATASEAVGGWVCETGGTILEKVTIVYSFCSSAQLHEHFDAVYGIAERIKTEMSQEAVTLEVNGQVKFV